MGNFTRADRPDLRRLQRHHRGSTAIKGDKLHLASLAVAIDMHDRPNVPGYQPFDRNVRCQYDSIKFFAHK